jgi:hypothetical protein
MLISGWLKSWRVQRDRTRSRRPRPHWNRPFTGWAAECLEARALLSNIAVTTTGGVISLVGDTGDHTFTASVVGPNLELAGSSGTTFTFNSTTNPTVDIPLSSIGTINGIQMTMPGGGNNTITFDATGLATVSGTVMVTLGDGTNSFTFEHATVTGKMTVSAGSGADSIQLSNDTLGALSIWAGDGNDTVTLSTVTINGDQNSDDPDSGGGWWGAWWDGWWDGWKHLFDGGDGSLNIHTGNGNDTITLNSVTGTSVSDSADPWHLFDGLWCFGSQWRISTGSGTDTVTFDTVTAPKSLSIQGGFFGNATVNLNDTTVSGHTNVDLDGKQGQIQVSGSTFTGPTSLSTGLLGNNQTIAVDDSKFESFTSISDPGSGAQVKLETKGTAGPGTTFQDPVVISTPGPSAVVDFAATGANNSLDFSGFVFVFGGDPATTVNIATANTTIDNNKLFLFNANRHDV